MASGSSSGRPNSGSKGFDFASDDILCSYEDYVNQDNNSNNNNSNNNNNGTQSDHSLPVNPTQDFQKSRISRSSMFPTTNVYNQPEESMNQELISTVERTMKKYADNLMRFLEGISSRLSQLELYCYNLDKSIGEMRSDLVRDHGDADSKLKFLEKHLQEVHRSVQILRDKQELAETQKELAKLQFSQKESASSTQEEKAVLSPPEPKKSDDADTPNTQLALALPSQISTQPSAAPPQPPSQAVSQVPPYYLPHPQNHSQPSYLSADPQYRGLQPSQPQMNQAQQPQQYPQYQQQWSQQGGQSVPPPQPQPMPPSQQQPIMPPQQQPMMPPQQPQMPPPQQPPMQPGQLPNQMRAQAPQSQVYPPYMTHQPSNPLEPMQVPFPGSQQSVASRPEAMTYGYGGPGRPTQPQLPPQHFKGGFPAHQGDGYAAGGSHPAMSSGGPYMLYDSDAGRPLHASQQTHFSQSGYPPANPPPPNMPPPNNNSLMIRSPSPQQHIRSHPYNELIEKLVSMGYRGDHVVREIQRVEESGQPVDFNSVLDRINGHSPGSSQRSW